MNSLTNGGRNRIVAAVDSLNRLLALRITLAALAVVAATLYVLAYFSDPLVQWPAWWGWWDQGQYVKCAASLANLELTPQTYWYPLGYPLLGALFYRFAPHYAFLFPNLLLIVGSLALLYSMARRLVSAIEAVLLLAVFVVSYRGTLADVWVIPWNTIPTQFLSYLAIYLCCFTNPGRKQCYYISLCIGLVYLCRPADAACLLPLLAIGLLRLDNWALRLRTGAAAACIIGAFVGVVLLVNYRVFGSYDTPADRNNSLIGLFGYPPAWKFYWLAIDASPVLGESHPMLFRHMPWLWLAPAGLICLFRRNRWLAAAITLSIGASFTLYLNYNDLWPGNLYHYHLIHYLVWTLPLLWLVMYVGLRAALTDRFGRYALAGVIAAAFLVSRWHLKEANLHQAAVSQDGTIASDGDFLLLPPAQNAPAVSRNGAVLNPPYGVMFSRRPDGYAIVPKGTSPAGLLVQSDSPDKRITVGRLRWVFRLR
jgi:hypothetical protein